MNSPFGKLSTVRLLSFAGALLALHPSATAATTLFNTDPFAGSTALSTPGRQVVGNETFLSFNIATDVFAFDAGVFAIGGAINFVNALAGALPTGGVNAIVLQTFDNDANPATPFGAGNAADLIAAQLTSPGAGFFIYFNSNLDLPRLVYSTDLNDSTADLKILARLTNLGGQPGRDAMPTFTAANFQIAAPSTVPDGGGNLILLLAAGVLVAVNRWFRCHDQDKLK